MDYEWYVISPEFEVDGNELEPPEPTCDVTVVEAPTRRAAKVAAVRFWREERPHLGWVAIAKRDALSPYAGLRVELKAG